LWVCEWGSVGVGTPITTRLQIEMPGTSQAPQVLERAFDLPPATVAGLQPGAQIEVITNGPSFAYVTTPIKLVTGAH
jgi:hypothetical protein